MNENIEQKSPEYDSNGHLNAKSHLIDNLDIILEIAGQREYSAHFAKSIDHIVLHAKQEVEPSKKIALHC